MTHDSTKVNYVVKPLPRFFISIGGILLGVGLVLAVLAMLVDHQRAVLNTIIAFMFIMSIGLGSLFMFGLEYLVGAIWSVPFRRIAEILGGLLFIAPFVALPILFDLHHGVYHWSHPDAVATDKILLSKAPYLNETFFYVRFALINLVLWLFYSLLRRNSSKQDITYDPKLTQSNKVISAIMMPVFAVSLTLLSIDFIMSLTPHWFSTIFGVYYFAGSFLTALAALTFIAITLNERGLLIKGITPDHYYSLGALMFAFTNFWGYIAFSQFMLIWYANIPEETVWFIPRMEGTWAIASLGLIIIHFVVPYFFLLPQSSKKNPAMLKGAALWLLFAHFYDLWWLVMPSHYEKGVVIGWIELAFPIFAIGLIMVFFSIYGKNKNLIPIGDPKLKRGLDFHL